MKDGLLGLSTEVLDYGCGHGDDVKRLEQAGIRAFGWDPAHRPDGPRREADVVNLGYVVNVIENSEERAQTLRGLTPRPQGFKEESVIMMLYARRSDRLSPAEE